MGCAEKFKPVKYWHLALSSNDITCDGEVFTKVGIPASDDTTDELMVLVEELYYLVGYNLGCGPVPVCGSDEHVRLIYHGHLFRSPDRDPQSLVPVREFLDELVSVLRNVREVD